MDKFEFCAVWVYTYIKVLSNYVNLISPFFFNFRNANQSRSPFRLPFATTSVAICELSFQRVTLPTSVESLGLQDIQIRFLLTSAQFSRIVSGSGPRSWRRGRCRWRNYWKSHVHVVLIRRHFVRRVRCQ